jgi:hypothetical protein
VRFEHISLQVKPDLPDPFAIRCHPWCQGRIELQKQEWKIPTGSAEFEASQYTLYG